MRKLIDRILGMSSGITLDGAVQMKPMPLESVNPDEMYRASEWNAGMATLVGTVDELADRADAVYAEIQGATSFVLRRLSDLQQRYQDLVQLHRDVVDWRSPYQKWTRVWDVLDTSPSHYDYGLVPQPVYDDDFGGYILPPILDYSVARDSEGGARPTVEIACGFGEVTLYPDTSVWFDTSNETVGRLQFRSPLPLYAERTDFGWLNSGYAGGHACRIRLDLGSPTAFNELVFRHQGTYALDLLEVAFNVAPTAVVTGGEHWTGWYSYFAAVIDDVHVGDKVARLDVSPSVPRSYMWREFTGQRMHEYVLRYRLKYRASVGQTRVSVKIVWVDQNGRRFSPHLHTVDTKGFDWEYLEGMAYPPVGTVRGYVMVGVLEPPIGYPAAAVLLDSFELDYWMYRHPVNRIVDRSTVVQFPQVVGSRHLDLLLANRHVEAVDDGVVYDYLISKIDVRMRRYVPIARFVTQSLSQTSVPRRVSLYGDEEFSNPNALRYYLLGDTGNLAGGVELAPYGRPGGLPYSLLLIEPREVKPNRYRDVRPEQGEVALPLRTVLQQEHFTGIPTRGYLELRYPVYIDHLRIRQIDQLLSVSGNDAGARYDPNRLGFASQGSDPLHSATMPDSTWLGSGAPPTGWAFGSLTVGSSTVSGANLKGCTGSPYLFVKGGAVHGSVVYDGVTGLFKDYDYVQTEVEMAFAPSDVSRLRFVQLIYYFYDRPNQRYTLVNQVAGIAGTVSHLPLRPQAWDGTPDTLVRLRFPPVLIPEYSWWPDRSRFWFYVALEFGLESAPSNAIIVSKVQVSGVRDIPKAVGENYRPVLVTMKIGDRVLTPDYVGELRTGKLNVPAERISPADSMRVEEYLSERSRRGMRLSVVSTERLFQTQFRNIDVEENGTVRLQLYLVRPSLNRTQSVPRSDYIVYSSIGLIEITNPEFLPKGDEYLVAEYVALLVTPSDYTYARRLQFNTSPIYVTRNRTDYLGGTRPQLQPPEFNPVSERFYPIVEYYQEGNRLYFPEALVNQVDEPIEVTVLYEGVSSQVRLMGEMVRQGISTPVIRQLFVETTEVDARG